jgi:hypothetical protein
MKQSNNPISESWGSCSKNRMGPQDISPIPIGSLREQNEPTGDENKQCKSLNMDFIHHHVLLAGSNFSKSVSASILR